MQLAQSLFRSQPKQFLAAGTSKLSEGWTKRTAKQKQCHVQKQSMDSAVLQACIRLKKKC
jgi:hypothetical protein